MPKITPARPDAHPTHAESLVSVAGAGWCLPCYEAGSFTLASGRADGVCLLHGALSDPHSAPGAPGTPTPISAPDTVQRRSPRPRGSAARRPAPPGRPRRRARTIRRAADRQQARARAYGRRRAAARLTTGGYAPHPGWRHFIAPGWRVLADQAEALALIETLVDEQDWRADKRAAWTAILRQLVYAMDWDTGLVAALTAQRLGDAGARAPRTVSRVIAWARDIGLVVVVEHAASAEFLGTDHGRTPTYALVTNTPLPQPPTAAEPAPDPAESGQLTPAVDESGDLPASSVENKPLNGRRLRTHDTGRAQLAAVPSARDRSGTDRRCPLPARTTRPRQRRGIPRCRCGAPGPCSDPGGTPAPAPPRCSGPSTTTPTDPTTTAATPSAEPTTRSASSAPASDPGATASDSSHPRWSGSAATTSQPSRHGAPPVPYRAKPLTTDDLPQPHSAAPRLRSATT